MSKTDIYLESLQKICILVWALSIFYASYHVHTFASSKGLTSGRDSSDNQWEMFNTLFFSGYYVFWNGIFILSSTVLDKKRLAKIWQLVSFLQSIFMLVLLIETLQLVLIIIQIITFWGVAKARNPILMWIVGFIFCWNLNNPFIFKDFFSNDEIPHYFFMVSSGLISAKCISFCYDIWEIKQEQELELDDLFNFFSYCFYLPLLILGPLVRFAVFKSHIIDAEKKPYSRTHIILLVKKLSKIACIWFFIEQILQLIPFQKLSSSTKRHGEMNNWIICGIIYWLGQFFCLKYMVLYGLASAIAEFNGMTMHRLPICVSHVHRYSVLWREFDYGIYEFMKRYIYKPILLWMQNNNAQKYIPTKFQKFIASSASFVFVFIWHGLKIPIYKWALINFIGITLETIGTGFKKQIDKRMNLRNVHWNCIIEPIATIPLTAMYILNSSIFCGSLEAAKSLTNQLWNREGFFWIFAFIFFGTQTAVACRSQRCQIRS